MRLLLQAAALDDLEKLLERESERYGVQQSLRVEERLWAAFAEIAATPSLGHRRPDLPGRDYLFFYVRPFLLVYQVNADKVVILAVRHRARNLKALLRKRRP